MYQVRPGGVHPLLALESTLGDSYMVIPFPYMAVCREERCGNGQTRGKVSLEAYCYMEPLNFHTGPNSVRPFKTMLKLNACISTLLAGVYKEIV